jgi:hypothetical protein
MLSVGKGSRQNSSVPLEEGMALKVGAFGLIKRKQFNCQLVESNFNDQNN